MSEAAVEKLSETVPTTQKTTTGDVEIGNDEEKMKKDRAVRQGIFLTLSPSSVLNSLMKFYFLDPKLPHYKFMWSLYSKDPEHWVPIDTIVSVRRMLGYCKSGIK